MVNKEFTKDVKKYLDNANVSPELAPGSPRRYEPTGGVNKHNARIHKESEFADKYKNLPFEFSKPKKAKRSTVKLCGNCEQPVYVAENCVGVICRACGKYASVVEVTIDE